VRCTFVRRSPAIPLSLGDPVVGETRRAGRFFSWRHARGMAARRRAFVGLAEAVGKSCSRVGMVLDSIRSGYPLRARVRRRQNRRRSWVVSRDGSSPDGHPRLISVDVGKRRGGDYTICRIRGPDSRTISGVLRDRFTVAGRSPSWFGMGCLGCTRLTPEVRGLLIELLAACEKVPVVTIGPAVDSASCFRFGVDAAWSCGRLAGGM